MPGPDGDAEVGIVRAHLEEDAAKNVHVGGAEGRIGGATATLVDFNRAGAPLVEIVTQPDLRSADQARRFLQLLRQTVVELGISDAEMEKGSLRFDVNVSVRPEGSDELRTRTELKNLNSFAFAAKAIQREVERQIAVYEAGGEVEQETLHFDPGAETAPPLRSKEEAQDYRYFPEPDLVPIEPPRELVERVRAELPESPAHADPADRRRARPRPRGGSRHERARPAVRAACPGDRRGVANVLMNQFAASGVDPDAVDPEELGKLIEARSRIPRDKFTEALAASGDPGFCRGALPRRRARRRHRGARADRRADPRREPRAGGGLPGRQGGSARLLRRPGDEGDAGQGRPAGRERAPAREAQLELVDRRRRGAGFWAAAACALSRAFFLRWRSRAQRTLRRSPRPIAPNLTLPP